MALAHSAVQARNMVGLRSPKALEATCENQFQDIQAIQQLRPLFASCPGLVLSGSFTGAGGMRIALGTSLLANMQDYDAGDVLLIG